MIQSMYISFSREKEGIQIVIIVCCCLLANCLWPMVAMAELEEVEALVCPSLLSCLLAFRVHEMHSSV